MTYMRVNKICENCKKEFWVHNYRENEAKYCCHSCYGESKKGKSPWNKGIKWPEMMGKNNPAKRPEVREKIRLSQLGKNNSMYGKRESKAGNWKNGATLKNQGIRMTADYKIWREKVFKRDDYTCRECGYNSNYDEIFIPLMAHHIFSVAKLRDNNLYHHIFNIDNGITLCKSCHDVIHGKSFIIKSPIYTYENL
jgi:hypothetical protein